MARIMAVYYILLNVRCEYTCQILIDTDLNMNDGFLSFGDVFASYI